MDAGLAAPMKGERMDKSSLIYTIQFRYDVKKNTGERLLFLDETYRNIGLSTLTLSMWNNAPMVKSVEPSQMFREERVSVPSGMPTLPTESDLIRLAPNQSIVRSQWYSTQLRLPWTSEPHDGFYTFFHLKEPGPVQITLCRIFHNESSGFAKLLKSSEQTVAGEFCSKPVNFNYEILHKDE